MEPLINEKALDDRLASIARQIFLEEWADKASVSRKEFKETVRLMVQQRGFNRKQAAKYIGKSPSTVDRLVKQGELATTVHGTLKYFRKEDLDEWLDSGITAKRYIRRKNYGNK